MNILQILTNAYIYTTQTSIKIKDVPTIQKVYSGSFQLIPNSTLFQNEIKQQTLRTGMFSLTLLTFQRANEGCQHIIPQKKPITMFMREDESFSLQYPNSLIFLLRKLRVHNFPSSKMSKRELKEV